MRSRKIGNPYITLFPKTDGPFAKLYPRYILAGAMNEILTVAEAAKFLGKHPGTIRRWIISKKLKARKISAGGTGVFVLLKNDLLEFSIAEMVASEHNLKKVSKKRMTPTAQESFPI